MNKELYKELIEKLENDPMSLETMSDEAKNNRVLVKIAASKCPEALQFASESIKDNDTFILALIKKNPECFKYASKEFRSFLPYKVYATTENPSKEFYEILLRYAKANMDCKTWAKHNYKNVINQKR